MDESKKVVRAQRFAKALFRQLEADYWGSIEPEVFANVGAGVYEGDDMLYDKMSYGEARDAAKGMLEALIRAFEEVDGKK